MTKPRNTHDNRDELAEKRPTLPGDTSDPTQSTDETTSTTDPTTSANAEGAEDESAGTETVGPATADDADADAPGRPRLRVNWPRLLAYSVLPGLALLLTLGAGFLKWQDSSVRGAEIAGVESVQAARDAAVAILSYRPDTVEQQLASARDLLTGEFKDEYTALTNDVVIPGARQGQISVVANVTASASVSATGNRAVALLFVNQTASVGTDAPSASASSVKVTLDKVDDRWLISGFEPI